LEARLTLSDADLILKLPFLVIAWNGLKPSWSPGRPAGSCCPASSGEPRSSWRRLPGFGFRVWGLGFGVRVVFWVSGVVLGGVGIRG
jgi:hypothetical protein